MAKLRIFSVEFLCVLFLAVGSLEWRFLCSRNSHSRVSIAFLFFVLAGVMKFSLSLSTFGFLQLCWLSDKLPKFVIVISGAVTIEQWSREGLF